MKIFKYFFILLILLFSIFLSIGVFNPEINYDTQIILNSPVEQSFAIFNDIDIVNQMIPGYVSSELISGNLNETGSQYKLIVRINGKKYILNETITSLWKNQNVIYTIENNMLTFSTSMSFMPLDSATIIRCSNQLVGKNIFWKSVFPFFKPSFIEKSENAHKKLQMQVESMNSIIYQ